MFVKVEYPVKVIDMKALRTICCMAALVFSSLMLWGQNEKVAVGSFDQEEVKIPEGERLMKLVQKYGEEKLVMAELNALHFAWVSGAREQAEEYLHAHRYLQKVSDAVYPADRKKINEEEYKKYMEELALLGLKEACFIKDMLHLAETKDVAEEKAFLEKYANTPYGRYMMGNMLEVDTLGNPLDRNGKKDALTFSAERGYPLANSVLAKMYFQDRNDEADKEWKNQMKGIYYMNKAYDSGCIIGAKTILPLLEGYAFFRNMPQEICKSLYQLDAMPLEDWLNLMRRLVWTK